MKKILLTFCCCAILFSSHAQTNIIFTSTEATNVVAGNYNPATYKPSVVKNQHDVIAKGMISDISADSLKEYIIKLASYYNRNTGSDTVSSTRGIGASRRWVYSKFEEYAAASGNRLIPSYLQWDQVICGAAQHRNICAILPGLDTSDKSVIVIEGHIDSRCEGSCDTTCNAQGVEDNATGTALVMELARTMSQYAFNHTIVFAVVIGEEQGLYGGNALAEYFRLKTIPVLACQNNDVSGGITCGKTASPPGCTTENEIDSLHNRIFSRGTFNFLHKSYARFVKLEYIEEALPFVTVPTTINIMVPEDRTSRGGDHIPFGNKGFTAVRIMCANEHGNANSTAVGYEDRQHSTRDTLGIDNTGDGIVDSFFVDFNYLKRNAIINGVAAGMAGIGPKMPAFTLINDSTQGFIVDITAQQQYKKFKINVRRTPSNYDLDLIFEFKDTTRFAIPGVKKDSTYYVSVASVDSNGVESLFTTEKYGKALSNGPVGMGEELARYNTVESISANPNPFHKSTTLKVVVNKPVKYNEAWIEVTDDLGRLVSKLPLKLNEGVNEVSFNPGRTITGWLNYVLYMDGKIVHGRRMLSY